MSLGVVMLCHDRLDRAAQVAEHWASSGCPVVIHLDSRVPRARSDWLVAALRDHAGIRFCRRFRCDWGSWSLVEATQAASALMLDAFPEVEHVLLSSGSCLPLRPVDELRDYLAARPETDFIESVTTEDVPWTKGGLDIERFTLFFPFSWKRHRRLFDRSVAAQRRLGLRRRIPEGIEPHLGSQWWCLTRRTLDRILGDPRRAEFDRYFRHVWIPDESYFQTLVRRHALKVESRSLTLSKFDVQGKPHVFYDDHLQILRRSNYFVARKIWHGADRLYAAFLTREVRSANGAEPNPAKVDRIFTKAVERRTRGRAGLYMASRFPNHGWENGVTCAPYGVLEGFGDLIEDFPAWLARATGAKVHGHLFAPARAEFAEGQSVYAGALPDSAILRDYNPRAFLANLIWNTRGERQCFLFGPRDAQAVAETFAYDSNAQVGLVTGAWAVPLFRSDRPFAELRKRAAELQKIENAHLTQLRGIHVKARVRIWSMAEFLEAPMEPLQAILGDNGQRAEARLTEAPRMVDLAGFGQFLQDLKNDGMQPYLMGDFPAGEVEAEGDRPAGHPRAVR